MNVVIERRGSLTEINLAGSDYVNPFTARVRSAASSRTDIDRAALRTCTARTS